MEKSIKDVFGEAKIPESFEKSKVCSLSIDSKTRGVDFVLKLTPLLPYSEIENLKNALIKAYVLDNVKVKVLFDGINPEEELDIYKAELIIRQAILSRLAES